MFRTNGALLCDSNRDYEIAPQPPNICTKGLRYTTNRARIWTHPQNPCGFLGNFLAGVFTHIFWDGVPGHTCDSRGGTRYIRGSIRMDVGSVRVRASCGGNRVSDNWWDQTQRYIAPSRCAFVQRIFRIPGADRQLLVRTRVPVWNGSGIAALGGDPDDAVAAFYFSGITRACDVGCSYCCAEFGDCLASRWMVARRGRNHANSTDRRDRRIDRVLYRDRGVERVAFLVNQSLPEGYSVVSVSIVTPTHAAFYPLVVGSISTGPTKLRETIWICRPVATA